MVTEFEFELVLKITFQIKENSNYIIMKGEISRETKNQYKKLKISGN